MAKAAKPSSQPMMLDPWVCESHVHTNITHACTLQEVNIVIVFFISGLALNTQGERAAATPIM